MLYKNVNLLFGIPINKSKEHEILFMNMKEQLAALERLYQWYMLNEEFDSNEAVKWTLQDYCHQDHFDMTILYGFLNEKLSKVSSLPC